MAWSRFCRYELRTTDVNAAREFYTDVVGPELWGANVFVSLLPERAAALGAPAHWLGHIGTGDVEGALARVLGVGGQQLGPMRRGTDGSCHAALRDPFGAVMAVSSDTTAPARAPVAWHLLNSQDEARAFVWYEALFGWRAVDVVDLGAGLSHAGRWSLRGSRNP